MASYLGKKWTKQSLRSYLSSEAAVAGAFPFIYSDGKADGVRGIQIRTGSGLEFQVVPGRAMDIFGCSYRGIPLQFTSATGMTNPGYYEEPGLSWLRTFFGGLLATCGISASGAPSVDEGAAYGLHGRIGNAAAEDVSIAQRWVGDEYVITVSGSMREASVMGENLILTRAITTRLGSTTIAIEDVIENRGFRAEPLMMLYHFNFGFPLLSETARIIVPARSTAPRDPQSAADDGVAECRRFPGPSPEYREKVFFHDVAAGVDGRTFVALANADVGGKPLAVVVRYDRNELPRLTEWKMAGSGCYVCGLEPGTVNPIGRAAARKGGLMPTIEAQQVYRVGIELEVLDSEEAIQGLEANARDLGAT